MAPRLRGSYGLAVALALLGLCPEIVISTASLPINTLVGRDLGSSALSLQLASGLSNAGYAFGAVVGAQLAQRFVQRRLFLAYEVLFVVGSVVVALAADTGWFFAGRLLEGTATGLMLIAALPPLIIRFGVGRLPLSVVIVNIGLFGASTLGPLVGGWAGGLGSWRWVFWAAAAAGLLGWLSAALGYERFDPQDPDLPVDRPALSLSLAATALLFVGGSLLTSVPFSSPAFWAPFLAGVLLVVALMVVEVRRERPLMPMDVLSTQLPVTGIIVAMVGGATFTTLVMLLQTSLKTAGHLDPVGVGSAFWPAPLGLVVAAVAFGVLLRTRYVPVLVDVGLAALVVAPVVLLVAQPTKPGWATVVTTLLLGFGAGATVSPGLFLTGMGVPSKVLGRAFALVQLLRSAATFAVAPVVVALAAVPADPATGIRVGLLTTVGIGVVGLVAAVALPALSGARLHEPDLEAWLEEGERALVSPTTAVHVRPGAEDDAAAPLVPRRRPRS